MCLSDYWLSIFVLEVRKGDGSYYCGWFLRSIIAGIGRYLRDVRQSNDPRLLDKEKGCFPKLHNALDRQLRALREIGVGVETQQAGVFTSILESQRGTQKLLVFIV